MSMEAIYKTNGLGITTMLDNLDIYPIWESEENIRKYKDGRR